MGRLLKYDQARLAVLSIIAEDRLQPGDKLAPERQLVSRVNCSMITLRKALESLEKEGMLERSVGRGTFLKRPVIKNSRNGKILFVNVNKESEISCLPPRAWEYMQYYFNERGMDFQYLQVKHFSNEIVEEAENALGIMLYGWLTDEFTKSVISLKIPTVIVGNSLRCRGVPQVELDIESCAEMVTEELIRGGAEKIVLFNSAPAYYPARDLEGGFTKAMKRHGLSAVVELPGLKDFDAVIPEYAGYDAMIFESGYYYAFLAANRINHWNLKQRIAVCPLPADFIAPWNRNMIRASWDNIIGCFPQSIFETASGMLLEHILHGTAMKTVRLKPEIDCGD